MPTTNLSITTGNDDGTLQLSNGTVTLTGANIGIQTNLVGLFLFRDLDTDSGATIPSALLALYPITMGGGAVTFDVEVRAVIDASISDLSNASTSWNLTTASATHTFVPAELNTAVDIDVTDIVEEVTSLPWWTPGSNIAFWVVGTGGTAPGVFVPGYEHTTLPPAALEVEWEPSLVVITGPGIQSEEAFGGGAIAPEDAATITGPGIASAEAFGGGSIVPSGTVVITGSGIASAEAFGGGSIIQIIIITGGGIGSNEAFGDGTIVPTGDAIITGGGIPSAEAFGDGALVAIGTVVITGEGVASAEGFGLGLVTYVFPFVQPSTITVMNPGWLRVELLNADPTEVELLNATAPSVEIIEPEDD